MVKNILILILGAVLLFRIPSANYSQEVENNLPISNPKIEQLRNTFVEKTKLLLNDPYAGLLLGMVIGVKEEIPYSYNQALKNTGVIHVVVVSGQNLTLLAGFILGLSQYLGRRKTIWVSICIVLFYIFLTGFQIPVIRAAIMFFMASFAKLYGREGDGVRVLILTALIMLIINPLWLISISFQLSFLATIGVVILAPEIVKKSTFIPEVLRQDLCVTVAAQIMTAPILAFYFNQFSFVGLLVNLLVLWTIPFIMIFGAIALLVSLISTTLASIVLLLPNTLLNYFVAVVDLFNKPWANSYINSFDIWQLIGIYVLILSLFLFVAHSKTLNEDEY
jgi:competence protein ComEC